jgi:hypothetical protein
MCGKASPSAAVWTAPAQPASRRYCSVECQRMHWFHGDHARKCSHENPALAASTEAQRDHYTAATAELLRVPAAAPENVAARASTAAVPPHRARDGLDQPLSLPHMQQVHVERAVRTAPGPRQAVTPHRCCLAHCACVRLAVDSCLSHSPRKTAAVIAFCIAFHARMYLRSAARSTTADYNHSGSRQLGASWAVLGAKGAPLRCRFTRLPGANVSRTAVQLWLVDFGSQSSRRAQRSGVLE